MIIMAGGRRVVRPPRAAATELVPVKREALVGFRLTRSDADFLAKLAKGAGVGHLTLARLVVERYLEQERRRSRR
jgi:hypothetical protein